MSQADILIQSFIFQRLHMLHINFIYLYVQLQIQVILVSSKNIMAIIKGVNKKIDKQLLKRFQKYRLLGLLTYYDWNKRSSAGTAFLITPRVIITAAHNIYDRRQKAMNNGFKFYYSFSGEANECKEIIDVKFPEEYMTCSLQDVPNYDYCILILQSEVWEPTYMPLCLGLSQGYQLQLSGYAVQTLVPLDQYSKRLSCSIKGELSKSSNYQVLQEKNIILHKINTEAGFSGAPIIFDDGILFGAVSIHIGSRRQINSNYGRLITKGLIVNIFSWVGKYDRQLIKVLNMKTGKLWSEKQKLEAAQRNRIQEIYKMASSYSYAQEKERLFQEYQQKQATQALRDRFGGYIDFRISSRCYEYLTVGKIRLYYDLYSQEQVGTIEHLARQYFLITDKYLRLQNVNFGLQEQMPLKMLIQSSSDRQKLQKTLNVLNPGYNMFFLEEKKQDDLMERRTNTSLSELGFENYIQPEAFDCQISIKSYQLHQTINYKIGRNTTFQQILKSIKDKFKITSMNFGIHGKQQIIVNEENIHLSFEQMGIYEKQASFEIIFYSQGCFIGPKTQIRLRNSANANNLEQDSANLFQESQQLKVSDMSDKIANIKALAYNQQKDNIFFSEQNISRLIESNIFEFYSLSYKNQNEVFNLQCTKEILLKTPSNEWMSVQEIQVGAKMLGVGKHNKIIQFQLIQKKKIVSESPLVFYTLSVSHAHTFIGNNLIIHNQNTFEIKVFQPQSKPDKPTLIQVYKHNKIKEVFDGFDVYVGGSLLNPNFTFGDYQIYYSRNVYIYPNGYRRERQTDMDQALTVSEWKTERSSINFASASVLEKEKWQNHHLAIFNSKIIPIQSNMGKNVDEKNANQNIIVAEKSYLQRMHYLEQIPLYQKYENDTLSEIKNQKFFRQIKRKYKKIDEKQIFPLYLYTCPTDIYTKLNQKLRNHSLYQNNDENKQSYALINSIFKCIRKLPKLKEETIVYRGVAEQWGRMYKSSVGKTVIFQGFTSTSRLIQIAQIYASDNGVLFEIQTYSGKYIKEFSCVPDEQEVLLLPYTCFLIESYDDSKKIPIIKLKQVPQPCTNSSNIIFWVDDNPDNNNSIKAKLNKDIEVIDVLSTSLMQTILRDFFWVYRFLNKKLMIISDMVREQDQRLNLEAGVDLFSQIYNELGFSNKAIIYTSNPPSVSQAIRSRNINAPNSRLLSFPLDIIEEINKQFFKK